jgi:hypothetical protein
MNVSELNLVPLQHASLCMDCEMITAAHTHCCACGSAALLNLARTLNGAEDFTPVPRTFAVVGSVERSFSPQRASRSASRQPRSFGSKCLSFPQVPAEVAVGSGDLRRPHSLREVAAAVQRAMTFAVVGILVLGAALEVRGRSVDVAITGNAATQIYSRLHR